MIEFVTSNPTDALNTVLYVTQYLCIPVVSLFVFLRLGVRLYYKQIIGVEDCKSDSWLEAPPQGWRGVTNGCQLPAIYRISFSWPIVVSPLSVCAPLESHHRESA